MVRPADTSALCFGILQYEQGNIMEFILIFIVKYGKCSKLKPIKRWFLRNCRRYRLLIGMVENEQIDALVESCAE